MESNPSRRSQKARISLTEDEALDFLNRLADERDSLRESVERNPRAALLEYRIDVSAESVPETVTLPSADQVRRFVDAYHESNYMGPQPFGPVLGWAILHIVLGAMPLVAVDE